MNYEPPFIPASRRGEASLHDRIARARKAREDTAERNRKRYPEKEFDERRPRRGQPWRAGKWHANGGQIALPMDRPRVL